MLPINKPLIVGPSMCSEEGVSDSGSEASWAPKPAPESESGETESSTSDIDTGKRGRKTGKRQLVPAKKGKKGSGGASPNPRKTKSDKSQDSERLHDSDKNKVCTALQVYSDLH